MTSAEIVEHLDSIDTLNPKYDDYSEAYSSEKWIRAKDILDLFEKEETECHRKLKDPELPDLCQANLSGMIIELRFLKTKLKEALKYKKRVD